MTAAPPPLANARRQAKYSFPFRRIFWWRAQIRNRKEYFAWLCSERAGGGPGLYFCSDAAEFLPLTSSFRRALASGI